MVWLDLSILSALQWLWKLNRRRSVPQSVSVILLIQDTVNRRLEKSSHPELPTIFQGF
jgi:hypothetical protein